MELFVTCLKLLRFFFLKKSKYTAPWTTFLGQREYYRRKCCIEEGKKKKKKKKKNIGRAHV